YVETRAAAGVALLDLEADVDPLAELGDVGDDADEPTSGLKLEQGLHREVEGLGIEAAEALIDEDGLEVDASGVALDHVGQPERERERGDEPLAAAQRGDRTPLAGVMIEYVEIEPLAAPSIAHLVT